MLALRDLETVLRPAGRRRGKGTAWIDWSFMMEGFSRVVASGLLAVALSVPAPAAQRERSTAELEAAIVKGGSVPDLVAYAYRSNPSIRAARENWRAVVERYRVATGYPDPQLMVTYFPDPIETRLGPQDWNFTLSQGVPFPGKLSKVGEVVSADARVARLGLDKAVRDVIVQIRESYHELLYIREAKKVLAENRDLLDHLRKLAETAHAQGRTTFYDVTKAQSQEAQLEYDGILLDELGETERTKLNSLLNRPPGAEIGPLAEMSIRPLAYDLDQIYHLADANQEEIQMADAQVEKARAKRDLATYQNLPDFRLGLFYAKIGQPDVPMPPPHAGRDAIGVQAGLTIPIWFGKDGGRIGEARAEEEKARAMKTARMNDTNAMIRSTYFRLRNADRLVRLYADHLLPQAAHSMEIAETWFQEGQGSFSDFVETESTWYNFQLSLARARADYGKYLARLERLAGTSLTAKGEGPQPDERAPEGEQGGAGPAAPREESR
jgi:cobalt-zinc-cadmium efflux system outer membrane protein